METQAGVPLSHSSLDQCLHHIPDLRGLVQEEANERTRNHKHMYGRV